MKIKRINSILLGTCLGLVLGCGTKIKPFESKAQISTLSYDEKLVWHQSKEFEKRISKGEHLYENEELRVYLQEITNQLFPDFKGNLKVHVVKSPSYNAFALPNGGIYINLGLLAALDNEAQVASVLGHEGAHFLRKHGAIKYSSAQSANVLNAMLSAAIPIAGLLSSIATTSSMYGYSRDAERESDKIGFDRMVKAGYEPTEAAGALKKLLQEVKDSEIEEPFFFASHPKLQSRIDYFDGLVKEGALASGTIGKDSYHVFVSDILRQSAQLQIDFGRYNSVISLLKNEERLQRYGGAGYYYLAEAKRKKGETDDAELVEIYSRSLELEPTFYDSHKGLGLIYYKSGDKEQAKHHLSMYLNNKKNAADKGHVQFYLNKLI